MKFYDFDNESPEEARELKWFEGNSVEGLAEEAAEWLNKQRSFLMERDIVVIDDDGVSWKV